MYYINWYCCHAMVQAVSHRPQTAEARVLAVHVGFVVDKLELGQVFLQVLQFSLSVSFHCGSPYSYIIWGMNNRPVGGCIVSHHRHKQHEQLVESQWMNYFLTMN
jgi:hypothetical protein